jgi:Protein of unknown function (DUF1565)
MNRLTNPSLRPSRKLLPLSLLAALFASTGFAATYYVATNGSDTHAGTQSAPFKSITKAQSTASSGDTVYIRGGTYSSFTIAANDSTYNYVHQLSKSGITYAAYSGETPIFDFSSITTSKRVCGFQVTGSDITIKGLVVTGTPVGSQEQSENFRITGSVASCAFYYCVCHDTAANGFYFTNGASGSCSGCDSYNNIGTNDTAAGNTDGFGAHGGSVTFDHCRSWHNSDDGYDCINCAGNITFDHCWSYLNGVGAGNGNGFKVGGWGGQPQDKIPNPVPVHTVSYCLSANNASHGFYANHQPGQAATWTHNTAYNNGGPDFDMLERTTPDYNSASPQTNANDIDGVKEVMHYNIAYAGTLTNDLNESGSIVSNNSWTKSGVTVSSADFQSTDATQMTNARPNPGAVNLPTITFMHLVSGSDLAGLGCF